MIVLPTQYAISAVIFLSQHSFAGTIERIATDTDRDYILGAADAVTYGLVDEVLVARNRTGVLARNDERQLLPACVGTLV